MNTPPYPIRGVTLREQIDTLRSYTWNLYACDVELIDGTLIKDCSVESDPSGLNIAYETLMDEAGNLFDTWTITLKSGAVTFKF